MLLYSPPAGLAILNNTRVKSGLRTGKKIEISPLPTVFSVHAGYFALTAAEAIEAAGLNYNVELVPLFTQAGNPVPRRQGVIRSDTNQILGTVGQGYTPIQNAEAFQFLDSVVADDGLRYHTAGALGKGEKIWMLAKLPGHIRVKNTDDITDKFLLLHNSHDGSSCLRVHFTPVRVVCQNTLAIAERNGRGQGIWIMHKGELEAKIQEAQKVLGLANRFYDDLQPKIDLLAGYLPDAGSASSVLQHPVSRPG